MERERKKNQHNFKLAKLPEQYLNKTFDDYEIDEHNKAALKAAKDFLQGKLEGIFYYGRPGTGKTFLSAIIAQEFLKKNKSVIFGDVPSLLEDLRGSYDSDSNSRIEQMMNNFVSSDLIVLDDLGTENPTEWAVERLYLIINQRYNTKKPVIATSNFRLGEIAQRLNNPKNAKNNAKNKFSSVTGDRIVSRLAQMCNRVELAGNDRRIWEV